MKTSRISILPILTMTLVVGLWAGPATAVVTFTDISAGLPGVGDCFVTWGDYDSDGDLDVAISGNTGSGYVARIYRNDAGVFTDIAAGLPGVTSSTMAWGDYDNDGDLDLFLMGGTGTGSIASVYRNDGGVFTDIGAGLPGTGGGAAAWGDYDNDGDLDLLIAGSSGASTITSIYRNDGGGVFTDIAAGLPGVNRCAVAWGDYDNDGDLDILMTGNSAGGYLARVYRNDAGTFVDASVGLVQVGWSMAAWGDYDADGDLDIAISGDTGTGDAARIYRNDGGGVFTDLGAGVAGAEQGQLAWGDFDNDGDLDLLIAGSSYGPTTSRIYRNDGAGVFTVLGAGLTGAYRSSVAWGDYDNDGDLDLLLAGYYAPPANGFARVYRSDGATPNTPPTEPSGLSATVDGRNITFTWDAATDAETPASGLSYNLRVGRTFDGEQVMPSMAIFYAYPYSGQRKVVQLGNAQKRTAWTITVPEYGTYVWTVQAIDGAYTGSPFVYPQGGVSVLKGFTEVDAGLPDLNMGSGSVAWGDYDGDGDLDLLATGRYGVPFSRIYRNEGGSVFTDIGAGLAPVDSSRTAWGDYDGDGDLDLVITGYVGDDLPTYATYLYRNDGGGSFVDAGAGLPGVVAGDVAWGDFDNDGDLDLLVTGQSNAGAISRVYRNDGAGVFTDIAAGLPGLSESSAAWGDYDNDGDLDLLLAGHEPTGYIARVYRNDGGGGFVDIGAGLPGAPYAAWGDYDNDGDLDIVVSGPVGAGAATSVYRNDGLGVFTDIGAGLPPTIGGDAAWGDYDNDGNLDLILVGMAGAGLYRNDGSGGFVDAGIGLYTAIPATAAWGDYDGDGDLDLVVIGAGMTRSGVSLLRNDGAVANSPPTPPGGLSSGSLGTRLTLNWSQGSDPETPAAGLSYNLRLGSTPGGSDIVPAMADGAGRRLIPQLGNAQERTSRTVTVPHGGTYYWSVQAVDAAFAGSPFSTEQSVGVTGFTDAAVGLPDVSGGAVAYGDFDNDGDLDLAITGALGSVGIARIYRNAGGAFTDIGAGLTGVYLSAIAWGDYDNDGDLDLVVTGDTGSGQIANIYRNDGGVFTDIAAGLPGMHDGSVAWGDYDNDGDLDLAMAGGMSPGGSRASIFRNDGGGTFTDIGASLAHVNYASAAWGDYDNDGDLDLVLAGWSDSPVPGRVCSIYRNDGGGVFADIGAGLPGIMGGSVAWGDYDSDGDLDLALAGDSDSLSTSAIYRNDGSGVFTDIGAGLPGVFWSSVAWGDLDNDGDLDLALMGRDDPGDRYTRIYRNDGGNVFTDIAAGLPAVQRGSVAWGDYDNDGDLDLALQGDDNSGRFCRIYRNDGTPANSPPSPPSGLSASALGTRLTLSWSPGADTETPAPGLSYNLRVGTAPGGGDIFSAMADASAGYRRVPRLGNAQQRMSWTVTVPHGGIYYWSVQAVDGAFAGSSFAPEQSLGVVGFTDIAAGLPGVRRGSAVWGDYDNDGDLDLVVTGESPLFISSVYRNEGGGTFADIGAGLPGLTSSSAAWGDYDGDGDLDLVLTGSSGPGMGRIYRNDGGGVFTDIVAGLPDMVGGDVAWGDFDNDGDLDLALTGFAGASPITRIYRNEGGETFTDISAGLPGLEYGSLAWGDYDNDGDLDLALTGYELASYTVIARIYRNDGGGVFTDIGAGFLGTYHSALAWGDYDGDGDLDLVMSGALDVITHLYRNDGGDVFADVGTGLPDVFDGSVAWGDYDNDGDLDLALTGRTIDDAHVSRVYRNEGSGAFVDIGAGLPGVWEGSVAWGDYDNDGDLDLLLTGDTGAGYLTRVYRNDGASANTPPSAPAGPSLSASGDWVTLSWGGSTDAQTPSAALSYNLRIGAAPGGDGICAGMAGSAGYRRVPRLGNMNETLTRAFAASAFRSAGSAYWSVQAIDGAWAGSPFTTEQPFTLAAAIQSVSDVPADQGGQIRLNVTAAPYDSPTETLRPVASYNVWQRVEDGALAASVREQGVRREPGEPGAAGQNGRIAAQPVMPPSDLPLTEWSGRYFVRGGRAALAPLAPTADASTAATANAPAFPPGIWELIGNFAAAQLSQYTYRATTVADSPAVSVYLVTAHTTLPSLWFMSDPDSGWSVDNIAPGVPQGFAATYTPAIGTVLEWQASEAEDFQYFRVYRDATPDFDIAPENLVQSTAELSWTDLEPLNGPAYYKLTAVDHAGNESEPATLNQIVGVPEEAPPVQFALRAGAPNPFGRATKMAYDLAEAREVRIDIFDVHGRRVKTLVAATLPAGRYHADWDGTDSKGRRVAAGAYLCRMRAGSFHAVRRLVLVQ